MRKNYIDNIKWMMQIIVVLYHVFFLYNAEGFLGGLGKITNLSIQYYDIFLYIVFPWPMTLLFIVSGVTTKNYLDKHSEKEYLISRTMKLLLPSTVGVLVFWFIQGYINMLILGNWSDLKWAPIYMKYFVMALNGIGVLWFIQVLWLNSIILLIIRKLEKNRLWELCRKTNIIIMILLTVAIWGAAQLLNAKVFVVYRIGLYLLAFLLGYYVFSHAEVIERVKQAFPLFVSAAIALGIVFCLRTWGMDYSDPSINRSVLFCSYCWFACLAVLGGMARFGNISNKITVVLSKKSYGIYLCHYFVISVLAVYVVRPGIISGWMAYLLSILAGFVGGDLMYALILKLPVLRTLLVGAK